MNSTLHRILRTRIPVPRVQRWTAHLVFAVLVWPLLTIAGTAAALTKLPYYQSSLRDAVLAALAGTALRLPEMLVVGSMFFGLSWFLFSRFGAPARPGRFGAARLALEPLLMFLSVLACVSVWYPAVLGQPLFFLVSSVPTIGVMGLLGATVVLGVLITGGSGKRLQLLLALFAVGFLSPTPMWARATLERFGGGAPSVILLGVDSMSHNDDLRTFTEWVGRAGGTWYERAVTPALFTNAVWASILTMQPVRAHGVFHTFQEFPEGQAAFIAAARASGYRTISIFPDQLTCAVGSRAGFDEDRSGPVGWRQLLFPIVANNSFLLPILTPALPRRWPGASPSNEAGTFTYNVRQEIRGILRAGSGDQRTLVAAHLTYTHLPAYPSSLELTWAEIQAVLRAPAGIIRDRTIDWQDGDWIGDPVPIRSWKIQHLQRTIEAEVAAAQYLERGGRLIVFSDHGSRAAITVDTFDDERYHHVVLATFGLQPGCPQQPISLIDAGSLLGFTDRQAEPAVEFILATPERWPAFVQTARVRWGGDVDLDPDLLAEVFGGLRRHVPWNDVKSAGRRTDTACSRLTP